MPLTMARPGETNFIKMITGKDETRAFLKRLGFVEGEPISVVSEMAGNIILSVKDTRIALNKAMASRIIV